MKRVCIVLKLGLVDYEPAWNLQKFIFDVKKKNPMDDVLILLEHKPTYTIGRKAGGEKHLLVSPEELRQAGIGLYKIERGGDITYHGPGQVVGYPIFDLKNFKRDVNFYLRQLEEVLILTLQDFNISASRKPGYTGVWVAEEKIASIGVNLTNWVTMHGFALNVNTDLSYFKKIVPCGITDKAVTSMQKLLSRKIDLTEVEAAIISHFGSLFDLEILESDKIKENSSAVLWKEGARHKTYA